MRLVILSLSTNWNGKIYVTKWISKGILLICLEVLMSYSHSMSIAMNFYQNAIYLLFLYILVVFEFELSKLNVFSIYVVNSHCYINNNRAFGSVIQFLVDLYNIIQLI